MANFIQSIQYVLENEGGFVDNPHDKGGLTKWGITQRDLSAFRGHPVNRNDMVLMEQADAVAIYKGWFWGPLCLQSITDQAVATCLLDTCVLHGIPSGVKMAQRACNANGCDIAVDGTVGEDTVSALNVVNPTHFVVTMRGYIMARIERIVDNDPSQARFKLGWQHRADKLLRLV